MIYKTCDIIGPGEIDVGASHGSDEHKSINFRVHTLASSFFKGATQYYGAHFGIALPEMRVLSNLGSEGPLAAHQIVALTAMDKALVSRVLTMLNRRRLIGSSARKSDPRRRTWDLTPAGQDLVDRLRPEWRRREAIIQAGLSDDERAVLADLLDRLFLASETLRAGEATGLETATTPALRKHAASGAGIDRAGGPIPASSRYSGMAAAREANESGT
jgi:DNA-binding MarR family transcriptional regulator